jgi:hypothetical protein
MLLFLTLLTFLSFQDTTGYDYLSEKGYDYLSEKNYLRNINGRLRYRIDVDVVNKGLFIYDHKDGSLFTKYDSTVTVIDSLDRMYIDETILYADHVDNRLLFVDEGGGRVFAYELDVKELHRLDKSYRFRSFYGSRHYYLGNNRVYEYGGAGEFSTRHRLLEFNHMSNQEWLDVKIDNPVSSNFIRTLFLDLVSQTFKLIVLSPERDHIEIYSANRPINEENRSTWVLENKFPIDKGADVVSVGNYFSNKNLINEKLNILGNYFYDLRTKELSRWQVDDYKYGIFKSFNEDSLIVVNTPVIPNGDITLYNPFNYSLTTFGVDDFFENETFEIIPSIRQQRIQLGLIVFAVLIFFLLGVMLYRKQSTKPQSANYSEPSFNVISSDNHIVVHIGSNTHYFYEDLEIKILTLIYEVTQKGLDTMELDVFDEKVFSGLSHKSHMTTKRNDAFKRINNTLGFEFIRREKSQEDKRRKLIKISLN